MSVSNIRFMFFLSFFLSLFASAQTFAVEPIEVQIDQSVPHGHFKLGVGSALTLKFPDHKKADAGIFLGRLIEPSGTFSKYMILDTDHNHIYLVDREHLKIDAPSFQPILRQYDQVGGTCVGYAMDHFFQEMYWAGFSGNGELKKELSSEKGRTQLLVDAINEYYLVTQHRFSILGIMKKFGARFGFKCEKKVFSDSDLATQYLEKSMEQGRPVLIGYNIGPDMVESSYEISDYENPSPMKDSRIWVPRKVGQRDSGGHAVIAVAAFEANHRKKLLMLDSDWAEPRIWDVEKYMSGKTAMDEIEFYSCQ